MKEYSLAERIPLWHFDGDMAIYWDGSLGAGFTLEGADISCASSEVINNLSTQLENLLKGMGEGMRLQVFYRLTPNAKDIIDRHGKISAKADEKHQVLREARLGHFHKLADTKGWFIPEVYFFLRTSPHTKNKRFMSLSPREFKRKREKFDRDIRSLESSLAHAELGPKRLSCLKWFELLFEHFNLVRGEKIKAPVMRTETGPFSPSLAFQLVLSDILESHQAVEIGGRYFRSITLQMLPEEATHASLIENLKMPFHFWLSQSIEIPGQQRELEKLQLSRRIASAMAHGTQNVSDLENESKLSALEEIISQVMEGQEKIVNMSLNVIIWADNMNELDDKSDEVLKAFRDMGQSEGLIETHANLESFLSSMPGPCELFRAKKVKTSNCAHLMPVYSYWKGNNLPVCLLPNREGALCGIDPFAPSLANFNALIFGGSGSGKSFAILQLMMMFAAQQPPPKVIWIDNGASSQRLLEVLGGEFINVGLESGLCLNPFDGEPTPSKIKLLLATIEIMLQDGKMPKLHQSLLEEAIYQTLERENPTLGEFRKVLENHLNRDMQNYAKVLYRWTGSRPFGRLLDGASNINLKKNLITIEIKGLDDYPDLQQVMLLLLTDFIKATPNVLLIIDEAWRLFSGPGQSFAVEAYRTFRKYGSGIWCISQNYRDFLADKALADTLMPNTASIFILPQKGIDWQDLQQKLQLNDSELKEIKGLKIEKRAYSELFLIQGENKGIFKIMPDSLAYWVASSDPNDHEKIKRKEEESPSVSTIEILQKLSGR